MKYNIFFYQGSELSLKTKVARGRAWIDADGLHIDGPSTLRISGADLLSTELFRLHGLGRVIRVEHRHGCLFMSVVRFMLGQFAIINFFKQAKLHEELVALTPKT
jgi:hypothetical protein